MSRKYLDDTGVSYLWGKINSKKQNTLVSGTNIKTINNQSLLGSGNITISGGSGGSATDVQINGTSITNNGIADIATQGAYDSSSNPIATMSGVLDTIDNMSQSQEFQAYISQIVSGLIPQGSELVVNTFEDLPTSNITEFTRAFVRYPSLYNVTTIAELGYDITQMHDCSPVAEPNYSQLTSTDYFTITYTDFFNKEYKALLMPGSQTGVLLFGYRDSMNNSPTNTTPVFVHTDGNMPNVNFSQGWNIYDVSAQVSIPITFNDVPLIPTYLMTVSSTDGNPLLVNNYFVDCSKHWAGEYRYINGEWRYQQTNVTPYFESNNFTVPTSNVLYSVVNNLYNQVQQIDQEIHGGGE